MVAVLLRAVNVHAFLLDDWVGISLPRMAHVKHLILDRILRSYSAILEQHCLHANLCRALEGLKNLETLELHYMGSIHVCDLPPLDVRKSNLRAVALGNIVSKQLSLPPSCDLCIEGVLHILARA